MLKFSVPVFCIIFSYSHAKNLMFLFFCMFYNRFLMVSHTTGSVMFTVLAFVYGKSIVVTCLTQT